MKVMNIENVLNEKICHICYNNKEFMHKMDMI